MAHILVCGVCFTQGLFPSEMAHTPSVECILSLKKKKKKKSTSYLSLFLIEFFLWWDTKNPNFIKSWDRVCDLS